MRSVIDHKPVWQLIVIGIRVVEKTALLHEQTPGVDTWTIAAIPAERSGPDAELQRSNSLADMLVLLRGVELIVLLPAPAMAADVIAGLDNGLGCRRMAFKRQRTTKNRQGQMPHLKQPEDTPEADAAAVFVHRFSSQIAALYVLPSGLSEPGL